ncbi:MAG: ribose-phosphate pyrophosphokinase, partial [Chloroflexi bacterium]|nr:ribose-phosphate pyrophosphokinase [Chloroflexota bacterium]
MSHHSHRDMKVYGGIKLYAGTGSPELAQKVADYVNAPLCGRDIIQFPNENLFIKLHSSVRGQDVYVIQTTSAPVHRNLMELLILVHQPRVPITARLVADMIEVAGADRYMVLDPHAGQVQGFFSIPGDVLTGFHLIADYLKAKRPQMKDPVVVTVDLGFAKKGRNVAAEIDAPIAFIEKRRVANDAKAQALTVIGDVENRDVILVDDEIDTGGSIAQAVNLVKEKGALDVYVVCVHPIFSSSADDRLVALPVNQFIPTDTVPISPEKISLLKDRLTVLSVAPLIGEVIMRAHEGRSVGEMF